MRISIIETIHKLDQTSLQVQNPTVLETIALVREAFLNELEQDAKGLVDATWVNRLTGCFSKDRENGRVEQLRLLTEPQTWFIKESVPETAAGIREKCMIQRNRIRFVLELEPALEQLKAGLPEVEQREETERIAGENHLAEEGLNRLLTLYRMKSREEQNKADQRYFWQVRRYEQNRMEKESLVETAEQIRDSKDLLQLREEQFHEFFEERRINEPKTGLLMCTVKEGRLNNVQHKHWLGTADETEATTERD